MDPADTDPYENVMDPQHCIGYYSESDDYPTEQEVPAHFYAGHGAGVLPSSRHLQHGHCCQASTQVQYSSTAVHYSILVMVQEFFLLLFTCNTVIVARHPHRYSSTAVH